MATDKTDILLIEPTSGISGDMFLASLLDLGLESDWLMDTIHEVLPGDSGVRIWEESKDGISGTRFKVKNGDELDRRNLDDITKLIAGSSLTKEVKEQSITMFELLAEVEADIHGVSPGEVHFHEVGAVDSIADVVGAAAGVWKINPERVFSTSVNLGSGTVKTDHGELPVPAPATTELLRRCEASTYSTDAGLELTTPTGALILATFVDEFTRPPMKFRSIGYGLGSYGLKNQGNFLRSTLGSSETELTTQDGNHEIVLETNIDDMNPELYPTVEEKLFEAGAHDVFKTPVQMKKNRPGIKLTVICDKKKESNLAKIIFQETTTLGIRTHGVERWKLDREIKSVETEFGPIKIKVGYLDGEPVNFSPEFESCKRLAEENDKPLKDIYQAALKKASSLT